MQKCAFIILLSFYVAQSLDWPCPFSRYLNLGQTGKDVTILQSLLVRSPFVNVPVLPTGTFDGITQKALILFQAGNGLGPDGILGPASGQQLLDLHMFDGYKDDGKILPGFKYKVHIKVPRNRTIETSADMYDSQMNKMYSFHVRLHGLPDRNQFCTDGDTPTGLALFDLNTPEDNPKVYGPYPVNRVVAGLQGNAKILLLNTADTLRSGILLHTGQWDNWQPPQPMPNSDGCIHTWPEMCAEVWNRLISIGVEARTNTDGKLPYPYSPQGLISIEEVF